jgi:MFS family permease
MTQNNENNSDVTSKSPDQTVSSDKIHVKKLGGRTTLVLFILGISGQIAWAVENTWFNTFVYEKLTPNPGPIAWMVVLSAITATVTTLFMGSLSDRTRNRWGRRRPYILFGYIFWGIVTIIFPEPALLENVGVAIVLVVILDSLMTFFGSTANDAAFSAWTTDISDSTNRGRVQGILSITTLLANLIALGLAGFVIIEYGYFVFFYILGGSVSILGAIAGLLLKEPEFPLEALDQKRIPLFKDVISAFTPKSFKTNKILFLLFLNMALIGIGTQIYFPYLFIYFEHYLGFSKIVISIAGAIVILFATLSAFIVGWISHRFNRKVALLVLTISGSINLFIFSQFGIGTGQAWIIGIYSIQLGIETGRGIILMAWIQDNYPKKEIGKFQGVRLIFMVAIPMGIGAPIGAIIIKNLGIPGIIDGKAGFIPTPVIFFIGAIMTLFALLPLLFIPKNAGQIEN